jgi:hypothetical protein
MLLFFPSYLPVNANTVITSTILPVNNIIGKYFLPEADSLRFHYELSRILKIG